MNKINKTPAGWMRQSVVIAILLAVPVIESQAQTYSLSANSFPNPAENTSLQVTVNGSSAGLSDWTVNGLDMLNYQWFYFSAVPDGDSPGTLSSIDQIATGSSSFTSGLSSKTMTEEYSNSTVSATLVFGLSASSASGQAQLGTTVTLENFSGSTETIYLYQLSQFNMGGNQTVQFTTPNSPYNVIQSGTVGELTGQIISVSGGTEDTVEEAAGDNTDFGLGNGNSGQNFNGSPNSATGSDVDYAYEISATLANGQGFVVSETQAVPEPSTWALIFTGMFVFGLYYGRKLVFEKNYNKLLL